MRQEGRSTCGPRALYTIIGGILFWRPYVMHMHGRWIRGMRTDDTSVGMPIKISLLAEEMSQELHPRGFYTREFRVHVS